MCIFNEIILNKKYTANKKNGGVIPAVSDLRTLYVPTGCGHCIECRRQKAREWQVRLLEDIKEHTNGKFVTLTFSTESLKKLELCIKEEHIKKHGHPFEMPKGYELDNEIATLAVHYWRERWRKELKHSPRHWLVTELGQKNLEHLHLHGIVFTDHIEAIRKHWHYGFVWSGEHSKTYHKITYNNYVNEATVNYITKYVSKMDVMHKYYKPKILTSPGIGRCYTHRYSHTEQWTQLHISKKTGTRTWKLINLKIYKRKESGNYKLNRYNGKETEETYRTRTGHKIAMPVYWRNKIYTDEEREKLWLQRLDKNERYVLGNKIDISKNQLEYEMALTLAQQKNRELGYGKPNDWRREKYEQQRRILIQNYRTQTPSAGSIQKGLD